MLRKLLWLALGSLCAACLGSCAVYKDPVNISYVDINTGIKAGHDLTITLPAAASSVLTENQRAAMIRKAMEVPEPASEAASSVGRRVELCAKYIPPKLSDIPKPTSAEIAAISKAPSEKQFESMLVLLARMYQYSKDAKDAHAVALKNQLASCHMVTVQ